ncbi:MAG: preprotein translocase subunit SecE [Planctomycetaceae bacterium]|nr:preprotein translocase subunit SecE [Planctomycetaceae bacterium]
MAKEKNASPNTFFSELFHAGLYKRSQGRIARQVTFAVLALATAIGGWRLSVYLLADYETPIRVGLPTVLVLAGWWIAYRLVNLPTFSDFLIAVEAEMNKVSWPTFGELVRSSLVVIFLIFFLVAVLFGYDLIWRWLLTAIGVTQTGTGSTPADLMQ